MTAPANLFIIPVGLNFAQTFLTGLIARYRKGPPENFARLEVLVNTRRLANWLSDALIDEGAGFLPQIKTISDLAPPQTNQPENHSVADLTQELELVRLIRALSEQDPVSIPPGSVTDHAASLSALLDEMQGENIPFSALETLDMGDIAHHWQQNLTFLKIIEKVAATAPALTRSGRLRAAIEAKCRDWAENPPHHPIIVAGSTGSRAPTRILMEHVAKLPQGAVVLPGFDNSEFGKTVDLFADKTQAANHAQARVQGFTKSLSIEHKELTPWVENLEPDKGRAELLSLALCPAPVTDQWLAYGPKLGDLQTYTEYFSLIEAPDEETEAASIAACLRAAVEAEQSASVVTPDRALARKIAAALKRWGIVPNDSAGLPLSQTPTGRLVLNLAKGLSSPFDISSLIALLKHPLVAQNAERLFHLEMTRALELWARKMGRGKSTLQAMEHWTETLENTKEKNWCTWVVQTFGAENYLNKTTSPNGLIALAETAFCGAETGKDGDISLWQSQDGQKTHATLNDLALAMKATPPLSALEFQAFLTRIIGAVNLPTAATTHPNIAIWGTLEARAHSADLTIIAGMNEKTWPGTPSPDPWLSRQMRQNLGLVDPDTAIGLMAHDFQNAASQGMVILSRSLRADDAETIPSRWLSRLVNLLQGLPAQNGMAAVNAMRQRGKIWQDYAEILNRPTKTVDRAPRPAPCPPVALRPKSYSATAIKELIRDPYTIYARNVLKLPRLEGLTKPVDARQRGIVFHKILEHFGNARRDGRAGDWTQTFDTIAAQTLEEMAPSALAKQMWQASINRWRKVFLTDEQERAALGTIAAVEIRGELTMQTLGVSLNAKPDRIDLTSDGKAIIYDYKSSTAPSEKLIKHFDKQLLVEALLLTRGGFSQLKTRDVENVAYIELLTKKKKSIALDVGPEALEHIWKDLERLFASYFDADTGFAARRAPQFAKNISDYDQLSRFGEWDTSTHAQKIKVKSYDP